MSDVFSGGHRGQCAGGANAKRSHRLAHDILAQNGAEHGAAVAHAREWSSTRALQLNITAHTVVVLHLAQQQCTAVPEPRHEAAELMSSVGHGKGFGPVRQSIACEHLHPLRRGKPVWIDPEMAGQGLVQPDQPRGGHRRRRKPGKKPLRQARVAVVECEWRGAGPMNSGAWVEMSVIWFRGARGSASKGCCAFWSKWQLRMFANRLYLRVGARARTRNGVAAIVFSRAVVIRRDDIRTRAGPNLSDRTPSNLWLPEFRTPQLAFRLCGQPSGS